MLQKEIGYFRARASLLDQHTIKLEKPTGEIQQITSEHILIAVGGRPNILNVPGALEYAQTSDDIFWSKKPYGKTLIIGSGYIALECAGFLNGLKKDVTVLY